MKLYYSPLACSLADHIALREAGYAFDLESVDLRTHQTASGVDFRTISPKGYVPALILDDGSLITENVAVLDWIAATTPDLMVELPLGRTRVLEMLTYITTEIHHAFKPMWHGGTDEAKVAAARTVTRLLQPVQPRGDYLFGRKPSVADFYLFVMLLWARRFEVQVPAALVILRDRIAARPAVRAAMKHEGLIQPDR